MTSAMCPVFLALLLASCLPMFTVEGVGSERLTRKTCMSFSTRPLPVALIRNYTIMESPLRATIFITKRGIKVCADPNAGWVKKAMNTVDKTRSRPVAQTGSAGTQQPTNTAGTLAA